MSDRLTLYTAKSIAKWLGDNVSGLDAAYVVSDNFDYDKKPDPTNPRDKVARDLPFIGVQVLGDESNAWTVSGGRLWTADIEVRIAAYSTGISALMNLTGDTKQQLKVAVHPVSGKIGIPLYDFGTPSGVFFDLVNTFPIESLGQTEYFGSDDVKDQGNRKFRSYTPLFLSAFKDRSAELLESLGNINVAE